MKLSKEKREMIGYDTPETIQEEWEYIGQIGVDAGLCWIGDPCYILHKEGEDKPNAIGENWIDFCNIHWDNENNGKAQYYYDMGHAGLGVCVSTGYGDGVYPVEARYNSEGKVAEVRIRFIH